MKLRNKNKSLRPKSDSGYIQNVLVSSTSLSNNSFSNAYKRSAQIFKSLSSNTLFNSCENDNNFQNSDPTGCRNGSSSGSDANTHTILAPPMPPIAPAARLRRANSSTLSLTKNKRKMLTVNFQNAHCKYYYCTVQILLSIYIRNYKYNFRKHK
jgi:hypothetical protein